MTDKEKIIKGLEVCTSRPCYCTDCPYKANCCLDSQEVMEDALALLKERPEIVRCKDCKNGEPGACGYGIDCDGLWHEDDWFCADGKRRDDDD